MSDNNLSQQQYSKPGEGHLKTVVLRKYSCYRQKPDKMVMDYLPMVSKIAQRSVTYLRPPLSFEDLISAGTIALIKATRDYDPSRGAEFKTYAYIRVRGAIIDELRRWSFVPANQNKQIREALEASRKIKEQTGNEPSDKDLSANLGITVDELYRIYNSARARNFLSMEGHAEHDTGLGDILVSAKADKPEEQIEKSELVQQLAQAIKKLTDRERHLILLYYKKGLTMKQISEVFELTESRVSQLHSKALFHLSLKLREWQNDGK